MRNPSWTDGSEKSLRIRRHRGARARITRSATMRGVGLRAEDGVGSDRPRLLLVEDDRTLAPLLIDVLAETYSVQHAADGQAGLHAALSGQFDLMVVDRGLPAIEGLELVARVRARGVTTPTLMLTARGTLADRVEGLDA